MSLLSKLFGGGGDPSAAANKYLDQIPGVGHQYYDPYVNQGREASERLGSEYGNLMEDPTGFINKLMEAYTPSQGYQFQKGQLTKELGNIAAAGGVAGTPYDQMNQAEGIQGLLGKDMQQFLANALGVYGTGLQGEQGLADTGFQASGNLADLLGGALDQQGGLAFQGAQQKNANRKAIFSALAKALGGTGGWYLGGLPGAKAGAKIFGG